MTGARRAALLSAMLLVGCSRSSGGSGAPAATATTAPPGAPAAASAPPAAPAASAAAAEATFDAGPTDTIETAAGPLRITPLHHASILFTLDRRVIYVDPTPAASLAGFPKADYVFVTDIHPDHFDPAAIDAIEKSGTIVVGPPAVAERAHADPDPKVQDDAPKIVLKNGDVRDFGSFVVEAVPMYNIVRGPGGAQRYHDKGRGDGYLFTFGGVRVYVSGDTECTPEMRALKNVEVAFVCMNLPYTMTPTEAAECVAAFRPKIVYSYHYRGQDPAAFAAALKRADAGAIDVRMRPWY